MITGIYIAIFVVAQVAMVVWIARTRMSEKVSLGAGESKILERRTRVYGNYIETVPMALLLMLCIEFVGGSYVIIHIMGISMILSRIWHAVGLLTGPGYGPMRMAGMLLTMLVYLLGAAMCIKLAVF